MLFLQIRKGIIHLKENQTEKKMTTVNMTSKKVQLCLLKLADYKLCASFDQPKNDDQYHSQTQDVECAICFKNICNKVFVCSEPCNKTFHPACLEKMVDQLEETAWEEEKKPDYRCCYCRREFDLRFYQNEIFGRYLLGLKAGGYDVSDAMQQLCKKLEAAGTSAAGTSAAGTAGTSQQQATGIGAREKNYKKKPVIPEADDATSQTQRKPKSKSGYCFVGEDKGFRSCIEVGEGDICMSGDIFPTQAICINPNLRE